MDLPSVAQETERPCLSTGHLPAPEVVRKRASPTAVGDFKSDTGRRHSLFPAALASIVKLEGDT